MAKANVLDEFMAKRETVSYDATQVDPATVAALNAAEDRKLNLSPVDFQREYGEALLAAYERIPNSREIARTQSSLPDDRVQALEAYGLEKGYLARNPDFPHNCYDALSHASEARLGWGFPEHAWEPYPADNLPERLGFAGMREATARTVDPLDAFIERRKPVDLPERDARQTELPLKRGRSL